MSDSVDVGLLLRADQRFRLGRLERHPCPRPRQTWVVSDSVNEGSPPRADQQARRWRRALLPCPLRLRWQPSEIRANRPEMATVIVTAAARGSNQRSERGGTKDVTASRVRVRLGDRVGPVLRVHVIPLRTGRCLGGSACSGLTFHDSGLRSASDRFAPGWLRTWRAARLSKSRNPASTPLPTK